MVQLMAKMSLEKPQFGEFCEGVKTLEFYGVLKGENTPKPGYATKVIFGKIINK